MDCIYRLANAARTARAYWRVLWVLSVLGAAVVGVGADGDIAWP